MRIIVRTIRCTSWKWVPAWASTYSPTISTRYCNSIARTLLITYAILLSVRGSVFVQALYIFPRAQLVDLEHRYAHSKLICYAVNRAHALLLHCRCEFLSKPGRNAFYSELRRYETQWCSVLKLRSLGLSR